MSERTSPQTAGAAESGIDFASLFGPDEVLCHTGTTDRDTLLREILQLLAYQRGIGNVDEALAAVLERERAAATIVAPGIAVPHARLGAVDRLVVGIATSTRGIVFKPGSAPVKLVILVLAPRDAPGAYVQALSSLAKICGDPQTPDKVAGLESAQDVHRFFERGGMALPDHLCAADIMDRDMVTLQETATLQDAIDRFVRHDLIDLPVVDADGDLVGVVSAYELLRVCLPDYILWMEDLSPILNFEPFAEVLRNESSTWLAEIMSYEYATVSAQAPAVEVAKEMTKQRAREVYVLRGKRLVGTITLQDFLRVVLRE